ncbi:outer membrane protein assembly factor BamB [Undibacterium curvum]|uniref:Outer membrane protein assembly factor BamB n=1 Tax=Undibacterium curvum TaxID=2762294 RepID=A0ABR7A7C8_9BURK|nr:outer membrane protein assembly factor BamB [Undibacterium curvum]MBC3932751.1 outer membrane protein assembly factor BamB [Undibacterium curvum]
MHVFLKSLPIALLAGLTACSSLNPFSSKSDAKSPVALVEIKSSLAVRQAWSVAVGSAGNQLFVPAADAGKVYAAAADGTVIRIDQASGKTDWRVSAGVKLTAGVGVGMNTVVVAAEKGGLQAFTTDGTAKWKIQESSEVLSAPVVGGGLVIVRGSDNRISAYDVDTGAKKWTVERQLPALTLRAAPGLVIYNDTVIVALPGGRMLALALSNGGVRWEAVVGEPKGATELERVADVSGMPFVVGKDVCASSYQGRVGCFDVKTGAARWSKNLSSQVGVGADERFVFAADLAGVVNAYAKEGGTSAWRNEKLGYRQLSAPVSFGRAVVVGDYAGYLHFLSREDGSFIGRLSTDGSQILGTSLVAGSNLIVQTKSGSVVAIATE